MHVRLIPHSPSGSRHLLAHYPLVSCIRALLAIYTDARAYRPSASLLAFLAGRVWTRHGSSTIAPPAFLYCWAQPSWTRHPRRIASDAAPRRHRRRRTASDRRQRPRLLADTVADAPPPTDANDHGPPANQLAAAAITTPVASDAAPRRHRRRVRAGLLNPRSIDTTENSSDLMTKLVAETIRTVHRPYLMGHNRLPFAT